jgi:Protein of unknown function (DUF1045)
MPSPRYAIYFTPPPFSALARFGAAVLGYDCFEGSEVEHARLPAIDPSVLRLMTVGPRRYGFHATLVAPFRLNGRPESELFDEVERFAQQTAPEPVGGLTAGVLDGYIVLLPIDERPGVCRLAAGCVTAFNEFRAPLTAADRERRLKSELTQAQTKMLDRWGYPYVFDQFRFHMTLAGPVPEDQQRQLHAALLQAYQERASTVVEIDALSVMKQDDGAARFRVIRRCRLRGRFR